MENSQGEKQLKIQSIGMVIGLSLEYLLGLITNLYVKFPDSGTSKQYWEFAKTQIPLVLHILLGLLLPLGAIVFIFKAFYLKSQVWKIPALIGLISIFTATISGITFVSTQSDIYSLTMGVSFIVAILSYGWGLL